MLQGRVHVDINVNEVKQSHELKILKSLSYKFSLYVQKAELRQASILDLSFTDAFRFRATNLESTDDG